MGILDFHSVTYLGSSSKWMGSYSIVRSSYNVNELLDHHYDRAYEKGAWLWMLALVTLGVGIGAFCASILFKKNFPSFWFFALLVLGAFGGLIATPFLVTHLAQRKQAAFERHQNGFTGRFVIIPEEKWDNFQKSIRTRTVSERMEDILKGR
jgi:hypothetical protein